MAAEPDDMERREAEVALIQAMYPEKVTYEQRSSDLIYTDEFGSLTVRLPNDYPSHSRPVAITAQLKGHNNDIREHMWRTITDLTAGEESLDIIINLFRDCASSMTSTSRSDNLCDAQSDKRDNHAQTLTTIIWLHHLLATEKRKLAIRPSNMHVSGISKPGYPGVMVFSGPAQAVRDHVAILHSLNWQAFQVRYEGEEEWEFDHGRGMKEVETMGDVVQELGEGRKALFLEAMRMKC